MRLFLVPLVFLLVPLLCASATSEEYGHGDVTTTEEPMRNPVVSGPTTGGMEDITGSDDAALAEASEFAIWELNTGRRMGGYPSLDFVLVKAQVQVVAGLMYTLHYKGNDDQGVCQEEHTMVIYSKPWESTSMVKSDTKMGCT